MGREKSITLIIDENSVNGVIHVDDDTNWNAGQLFIIPRKSVKEWISNNGVSFYGVYILLSEDRIYVGQATNLSSRINTHLSGKDWWKKVYILTTKSNSFTRASIDFLEFYLIDIAKKNTDLACDNKNKGNPPKVSAHEKIILSDYLKESLFLLDMFGLHLENKATNNTSFKKNKKAFVSVDNKELIEKIAFGKRCKREAILFLQDKGIIFESMRKTSYATLQPNKPSFWLNPQRSMIENDWPIILNNTLDRVLILLRIPSNTFSIKSGESNGFRLRKDRPDMIDMSINKDTLIDEVSRINLKQYVVSVTSY